LLPRNHDNPDFNTILFHIGEALLDTFGRDSWALNIFAFKFETTLGFTSLSLNMGELWPFPGESHSFLLPSRTPFRQKFEATFLKNFFMQVQETESICLLQMLVRCWIFATNLALNHCDKNVIEFFDQIRVLTRIRFQIHAVMFWKGDFHVKGLNL
jgi:hypothetical protein